MAPGNGVMVYFRTKTLHTTYQNTIPFGFEMQEELLLNPKPMKHEFSFRDPDGYFLTVNAFHAFGK